MLRHTTTPESCRRLLVIFALLTALLPLSAAESSIFRWYEDSEMAELRAAVAATNRPVFIMVGKPSCVYCKRIWDIEFAPSKAVQKSAGKTYDLKNGPRFNRFLQENRILGLYTDTDKLIKNGLASHFADLRLYQGEPLHTRDLPAGVDPRNLPKLYEYEDELFEAGTKHGFQSPYFVFAKFNPANAGATGTLSVESDFLEFFGTEGSIKNGLNDKVKTCDNMIAWITKMMGTQFFANAFPTEDLTDVPELHFWENASDLLDTPANRYDSSKGVAKAETAFTPATAELRFQFAALEGRRYVFSATPASGEAALPALGIRMTAKITLAGQPDNVLVQREGVSLSALDQGFFFEPDTTGRYVLTLTLASAPARNAPFVLRYHFTPISDEAGTLSKPLWRGIQNGKWSMDIAAALNDAQRRPFFLYFSGLTWCPHCVTAERLLLDTEQFRAATVQYPLVLADNRRRGDVSGPALLYCDAYRNYVREVTGCGDAEVSTLASAYLSNSHALQQSALLPGQSQISYPTLALCVPDGLGGMRVVSRTNDLWNYPADTDFAALARETVEKMAALLPDTAEESDNEYDASTTPAIALGEETQRLPAWIGGYDRTDWRRLDCAVSSGWRFALETATGAAYDPSALVTLQLLNDSGEVVAYDSGTWASPPEVRCNVVAGETRRLCIAVQSGTQAHAVVPYSILCETNLPPFEVAFLDDELPVTDCTQPTTVTLCWTRLNMETTSENGAARLQIGDTSFDVAFGEPGVNQGTVSVEIPAALLSRENRPYAQSLPISLTALRDCRVATPDSARLRIFTLPAFVDDYGEGTLFAVPVRVVQNQSLRTPYELPFLPTTDGTGLRAVVTSGELPDGIALSVSAGALQLSGKCLTAGDDTVTVVLQKTLNDGTTVDCGSVTLQLHVAPLEELNAYAGAAAFSGTLRDSSNTEIVVGTLILTHEADRTFRFRCEGALDLQTTLPAWEVDADGTVSTQSSDGTLEVSLTSQGVGTGTLHAADGTTHAISFGAQLPASDAADKYAGTYNLSLESSDRDYTGFGWLFVTIAEDGQGAYRGELPDGTQLSGTCPPIFRTTGAAAGCVALYFENASAETTLGGQFQILTKPRVEGEPCVSACDSGAKIVWQRTNASGTKVSAELVACGSEYHSGQSLYSQLEGEGAHYQSLNFYAFTEYGVENLDESCDIAEELLPRGIGVSFAPMQPSADANFAAPDGFTLYPGLDPELHIGQDGAMSGAFNLFRKNGLPAGRVEFRGIFTPIAATCCGSGPDAVAFGHILWNGRSFPVWVRPDVAPETTVFRSFSVRAVTSSAGGLLLKTAETPARGVAAVLIDDSDAPLAISSDGEFNAPSVIGQRVRVASAGYGLLRMPEDSAAQGGITYRELDCFATVGSSGATPATGWRLMALPDHFRIAEGYQSTFPVYGYNEKKRAFQQYPAGTPGTELPSAFFVHSDASGNGVIPGVVSANAAIDSPGTSVGSGFRLAPFHGTSGIPAGTQCWFWNETTGRFVHVPPVNLPEGFLPAAWQK